MKKIFTSFILLIVSICFSQTALSQSTDDLDRHNGFKNFKFGEPLSKHESVLKFSGIGQTNANDRLAVYRYFGSDESLTTLFDFKMDSLTLAYQNDSLVYLELTYLDDCDNIETLASRVERLHAAHKSIISNFQSLFGDYTSANTDNGFSYSWVGRKVFILYTNRDCKLKVNVGLTKILKSKAGF